MRVEVELFKACVNGKLAEVNEILATDEGKKSLSEIDEHGCTPLNTAAFFGHTEVVKAILSKPEGIATLSTANYNGWTPLHIAAKYGYTDVIKAILDTKEGADLLSETGRYNGTTPLELAYVVNKFNQFVAAFGFVDRMKLYASHPIMTVMSNKLLTCAIVGCTAAVAYVCVNGLNFSKLPEMLTKSLFASSQPSMGI